VTKMTKFQLTEDNYYSQQAEYKYLTNSQRKTFDECPARWLAKLTGEYEDPDKQAFFEGHYIDIALTESPSKFEAFVQANKARIYQKSKNKKLKAFIELDMAIQSIRDEPLLMEYLQGEPQTIISIDDFHGVPYKCKLDVLNLVKGFITDLKSAADLYGEAWSPTYRERVSFIDLYEYWTQLAMYREAVYIKYGELLKCFLVIGQKKPPHKDDTFTDRQLFELDDHDHMENAVREAGKCSYCIGRKVITEPRKIKHRQRF